MLSIDILFELHYIQSTKNETGKQMAKDKKTQKSSSDGLNLGAKASKREGLIELDKNDIPYNKFTVTCACGAEYAAGSTLESLHVDICAACHPFFTGDAKFVDAEGRIEKFRKKYKISSN